MFSPQDFHKNDVIILKMNECNSPELDLTKLTEQTKIRLNKIIDIEN